MFPLTEEGLLKKQYERLIDISVDRDLKDTYTTFLWLTFGLVGKKTSHTFQV
jgi:hypothetical protein